MNHNFQLDLYMRIFSSTPQLTVAMFGQLTLHTSRILHTKVVLNTFYQNLKISISNFRELLHKPLA